MTQSRASRRVFLKSVAITSLMMFLSVITAVRDAHAASARSSTTLVVAASPSINNIPRIGVNLSPWTYYGAEQYQSNIVLNPGFEPIIDRALVSVGAAGALGFNNSGTWPAYADNFWANAAFEVLTGQSAGVTGNIASSQMSGWNGLPWFETVGNAPAVAAGDVISLTRSEASGGFLASWWWPASSNNQISINTADARPGSPGISSGQLKLQAYQNTEIDEYWDTLPNTIPGGKFLPINGAWQLSFWARATVGSPTLTVDFQRLSAGSTPWVGQSFTLGNSWQQYTINFTAADTGSAGTLDLQFIAGSGAGAVRLDDVQLGRPSDFANPLAPAWRSELIGALSALRPGYLRDWQSQLGDTTANRLASAFGRSPERWEPDPTNTLYGFLYGLPDFLSLCSAVGANPWIVIPNALNDTDMSALGSYLASAQSTYNFSEIVLEFGDENWNALLLPASIIDPITMGQAANRAFAKISAAAGALPLHLVVNSQFVNPWVGQNAVANAPLANAADVATYFFDTVNASDSAATLFTNLFDMSDAPPLIAQLQSDIPSSVGVDVYEVNLGAIAGDAPESMRDPYVAGQAAGSALADRLITGMYAGVTRQNVWNLAQYDYNTGAAGNVALWGIARDLATSSSFRPTGLALQMLNSAVGGAFYPVSASGPGAGGLNAAAFFNNRKWSFAITSANSTPTQITLSLPARRVGKWSVTELNAPSPTATNESSTQVLITSGPAVSNPITLSIPAYGFVVLLPVH